MVTAPGYEDVTRNFTLNSSSCVSEDLLEDLPLHEAQTINIKMLPKGRRAPVPFSFQPASPPRNRIFYPDKINPDQEETKTISTSRKRPKTPINLKSRTNSKIPSNRPSVFKTSNTLLGTRNTTPRLTHRPRRRRRRPIKRGKNPTVKVRFGLRDAFVDEDEHYFDDEMENSTAQSHIDGLVDEDEYYYVDEIDCC